MANLPVNRTSYSEIVYQLQSTDPVANTTFNPLFQQLLNNDAFLHDIAIAAQLGQMFPSQYPINLAGLTIGAFTIPYAYVTLGTITLG